MKKLVLLLLFAACGGTHLVKVEPVTVAPIHVTVDVNVHDAAKK
jgi:hypothetical protein